MTIDIDKGNIVNPVDLGMRYYRHAEEALMRCIEILRAENVPGVDIADALVQRVYAVLKPERTTDAAELRTFLEDGIAVMDNALQGFSGVRDILAEELEDL